MAALQICAENLEVWPNSDSSAATRDSSVM